MVMLPFLVSGLMASVSVAGPMDIRSPVEHQCGTRSSSLEDRELFARQNQQPDNGNEINLGAVIHYCCGQGDECPSDEVAQKVIDDMNGHLEGSKIKFNLQNVSRIDSSRCNPNLEDDNVIKSNLPQVREGNSSTLNIVYVPAKQGRPTQGGKKTTGMCVKPESGWDAGLAGSADGCVVSMETLPKDKGENGDKGQPGGLFGRLFGRQDNGAGGNLLRGSFITSTHEMGHWLGLDHVGGGEVAGGPFGGFPGGLRRRQGGGTGNVMEPITSPNKNYKFTPEQFDQMRRVALGRENKQDMPIPQGPANRPQGPIGGPGGNNNGRPGTPGTGTGTQGPTKPKPGNRPGQNPQRPSDPSDDDSIFPGDIGTGFPGSKPSKPSNKPSNPGNKPSKPGNNQGPSGGPVPGGEGFPGVPGIPGGEGFPGDQGFAGGPNQGLPGLGGPNLPEGTTSQPIPAIEVNSLGNSEGSGSNFFTPNGPLNARAEPKAKADESGLGNVSGGHVVEGGVDGSGFVVIARKLIR